MDEKLDQPSTENQQKPLDMVITIMPDGNLKVTFPFLLDEILCFGVLEKAKHAIIQYNVMHRMKQQDTIIKPKFTLGAFGKKRF